MFCQTHRGVFHGLFVGCSLNQEKMPQMHGGPEAVHMEMVFFITVQVMLETEAQRSYNVNPPGRSSGCHISPPWPLWTRAALAKSVLPSQAHFCSAEVPGSV